jgi:hypothetical protein
MLNCPLALLPDPFLLVAPVISKEYSMFVEQLSEAFIAGITYIDSGTLQNSAEGMHCTVGAILSTTVMTCVAVDTLPHQSVAVHVRVMV